MNKLDELKAELVWLRETREQAMRTGGDTRRAYVRRLCAAMDAVGRQHMLALAGFLRDLADHYNGTVAQAELSARAPVQTLSR